MSLNKNVGIGGLDHGLCIIADDQGLFGEIVKNEAGLREVTFRFAAFNAVQYEPERGTKCPDFVAGNDETADYLESLDFLAAQTSKLIPNGQGEGVDVLEITCQGAIPTQVVNGDDTDPVTPPNFTFTTVKDTVEIPVYEATSGGAPAAFTVRAVATSLAYDSGGSTTHIEVRSPYTNGTMPPVDGIQLATGNLFLLADGSAHAGIYRVTNVGAPSFGWFADKVSPQPATNDLITAMQGSANAGLWKCTGANAYQKQSSAAQNIPRYKVTIDYRAVELGFEYMANKFAHAFRWIQDDEYNLDANGYVILTDAFGGYVRLKIINVRAIQVIVETDTAGKVTQSDGPEVAASPGKPVQPGQRISLIAPDSPDGGVVWQNSIRFIGDDAQFEQGTAGVHWHVKETATIKIAPIIPPGQIVTG